MKKNLRHPIDRTGLNLCKSVKSVGHNNRWFKRLDRIGRFPSKFRAQSDEDIPPYIISRNHKIRPPNRPF